jgi:hypothetical protein
MTPEEERDYQEALRRIHDAEENKSVELVLSGLSSLTSFPPELAGLTSLQWLNLSGCEQLSDLGPLAGLTSWARLPPIARPLLVRAAQRRPEPAGRSEVTPDTQPLLVHRHPEVRPP